MTDPLYNVKQQACFELIMVGIQNREASLAKLVRRLAKDPLWNACGYGSSLKDLADIMKSPEWHDFIADYEAIHTYAVLAQSFEHIPRHLAALIAREKRSAQLVARKRIQRDAAVHGLAETELDGDAGPLLDDEALTPVKPSVTQHPALPATEEDDDDGDGEE